MENFSQKIPEIEKKIKYHFKNPELIFLAFTHRSYWHEYQKNTTGHNERLEFLGDAVLNFLVADYLYATFPEITEGTLTEWRSQIVKAESCSQFLKELELESFFLMGRGERMNVGKGRLTMMANLFEALIGAIYLDGGFEAVRHFFSSHFEKNILQNVKAPEVNWKAKWQDYIQKKQQSFSYEVVEESGLPHAKHFIVAIVIKGKVIAEGSGSSKKEAQMRAAERALEVYGNQRGG